MLSSPVLGLQVQVRPTQALLMLMLPVHTYTVSGT